MEQSKTTTPKIFGIGWPKTGITTLGKAMQMMDQRYCGLQKEFLRPAINGNVEALASIAGAFDFLGEWPWPLYFREMDARFPGAKFILTVRNEDDLLRSYHNMLRKDGPGKPIMAEFRRFVYGPTIDAETVKIRYRRHVAEVKEYFKDRPDDLLIVDWSTGDGWDELERFTGLARPVVAFPHANKGAYA